MPLTVTLDPNAEQLLSAHLRSGRYHSPEEVVTRALETLTEKDPPAPRGKKTPAEAVAHIRESRKGVTLGGLRIKDLIHEGHKY
jgi:Arc/MetJ-type ribon-helix-helix transcriptional regulator